MELLALLWAARGESDDGTNDNDLLQGQQGFEGDRNEEQTDKGLRGGVREPLRRGAKLGALILGPHCERCGARAACPAFAAEALSLARHQGPIAHAGNAPPGALLASERAYLAGIIPAMRATLDRAEAALRAGGPVLLADGMVYGPALETVTSYRTAASLDRADADTTGCDGIADTGLDVAPVPQPHHWISDARIAYVVGLLHARHPWLCAAGITIDVMRSSVFNLRAHYCDQSRETYVDDTTTIGELDAWVTDLWRQFSIRHERVVFG